MELLGSDHLNYDPSHDHLIFVGDVINKGPKSREVLELLVSLPCTIIKGNHELGFLNYLKDRNGQYSSFEKLISELGDDLEWFESYIDSWPLFYEDEDVLVVHGGLIPKHHPSQTPPHLLTRVRTWDGMGENVNNPNDPPWFDLYDGEKLVVFGHWAALGLVETKNVVGLDSGCCWGGALSGLILPGREVKQVDAYKTYVDIN